ncbi:protelomerase family protein [Nostoc sp. MG11]|uniref:protelomerase family protein n=1 Tax=Nostoc sp. MG11 TaxID=2721166 RepID=UPI0018662242|nr:protelomerase family protein [Nostoc sp. MG11]
MSKVVQEQVDKLFEATKDLQSLEEIRPHCEQFNEWINRNTNYSIKSLGTVLSRAGFYKKFKSLPLKQGKNAESVPKHDAQGNVTGYELKHYVLLLCGLDQKDWEERNETTRVSSRLLNADKDGNTGIEINPDKYLEVTANLLASDNPHELAVGLIAATGRRPHEILARGKFTPVEGSAYQVVFEGQGKKRGQNPVFKISTLFAASYIIERLNHLCQDGSVKELLQQVTNEFKSNVAAQNKAIEDKRGNSLRRVVQEYFGGKDKQEPLLNFRHGQEQNDCKALRAACACLVTERDRPGSVGAKMLFYGMFLGHITPGEKPSDQDLKHVVTSLGYADYYVTKPVKFPDSPEKEKTSNVKVSPADLEFIHQLQTDLELPNQKSVVARLVEIYKNAASIAKKLQEAQQTTAHLEARVKQLSEQNNELQKTNNQLQADNQQPQTITLNTTELDDWLEKKVFAAVEKALQGQVITPAAVATSIPVKVAPPKEEIDWTAKSDADVWGSKAPGAALEKICRSFQAICLYNDTVATGDGDRLALTNQALRDLSGCNGLLVRDWIDQHKDEVISHNSKYGMENKKDPSNPASYANKGKDTDKIMSLINDEFLSGEGFRKNKD